MHCTSYQKLCHVAELFYIILLYLIVRVFSSASRGLCVARHDFAARDDQQLTRRATDDVAAKVRKSIYKVD